MRRLASVWALLGSALLGCRNGSTNGAQAGGGGQHAEAGTAGDRSDSPSGAGGVASSTYDAEVVDGGEPPDCGPGCRLALRGPVVHESGWATAMLRMP
jgi:hypothetical protein